MRESLLLCVLSASLALPALACGPDFPSTLLADRGAALLELPEGSFDAEASRLVPPPQPAFTVVDRGAWLWGPEPVTQVAVERGWLGDAYERVRLMRDQSSAAAAEARGEELPEEARQYTAGAVAFAGSDYAEARRRFERVLALPAPQQNRYGPLAQYSLARSLLLQEKPDVAAAAAAFHAVRERVAAGAQDPLGLAASSFGEEARLRLDAGDDAAAVALYAQQAALGSVYGRTSLLHMARAILAEPARLHRAVDDALTLRLLAAFLYSRADELDAPVDDDAARTAAPPPASRRITDFLAAVEQRGLATLPGADRLAAVAYRSGDYALAKRLLTKADGGLADWLRAKLALRDGDLDAAARAYAAASRAFPLDPKAAIDFGQPDPGQETACRVAGERGVLALSRSDYVAALEQLYAASSLYWPDAAYVAERVLSVDELKAFVEAKVPATPITPPATGPASLLRALLARRLLRAERYDEALRYFDDPALAQKAAAYVAARRAATQGDRIARAEGWYRAAVLAREEGIDLIGYELDPDYQYYGGNFDLNWQDGEDVVDGRLPPRRDLVVPPQWRGADEAERLSASVAQPLRRFHYRYVAVDFAQKAADLLPPRSQAFAAVLCAATGFVLNEDPTLGATIWRRYVKQGPYVPWAADFGRQCETPDFPRAAARLRAERIAAAKHLARRAAPVVGGALLLAGLLLLWQWRRRMARRAAAAAASPGRG